jgi:ATP-dependent DNA helicase RecQ
MPRATYDGTVAAQKLLSCVFRVRQKSGFSVGLNHVVAVLTGGETDKIKQWGHDALSTFGIGKEFTRNEWGAIGRELMRLGLLRQNTEKFNTLEITNEGVLALKERRKIILTKPREAPKAEVKRAGEIACDENLFEKLRILRKELADQLGVPPYIVFGDNTLRQMARMYPQTESEFRRISGVGDQKWTSYGNAFRAEIAQHLMHSPRQIFADDSFETPTPAEDRRTRGERLNGTSLESLRRFRSGQPIASIASERGLAEGTIYGHIASAVEAGESIELSLLFSRDDLAAIQKAFEARGLANITGVVEELGGRYHYGQLRVCRAVMNRLGRL